MAMGSLLLIGFFIGMRHALEADHLAAIASLLSKKQSLAQTIRLGSIWGLGHTITLLLFGSVVIFMDIVMPTRLAGGLEMLVGFMLVLLGADVLRRLLRDKVHFHSHQHHGGIQHFHAHSHAGEPTNKHNPLQHNHTHPDKLPLRALLVGLMHGMAGSAAVILLSLNTVKSPLQGLVYILVFGLGSMLGMALLSVIISVPMRLSARRLSWAHSTFQLLIGVFTIGMGMLLVFESQTLLFT